MTGPPAARRGHSACWHPVHAALRDLAPFPLLWATESGPQAPFLAGLGGPLRHATCCLRPPKKGGQARDTPGAHRWQGAPSRASLPRPRPACLPPSQWLPTPSWLPRLCPGGSGLQMGSRVGGRLLPPRPLRALGGLSEGRAASGGPLRTRVPDTPLLEPSLSAHCALPTGSHTTAAPTAQHWARCRPAPRLAALDRCPPPVQLCPPRAPLLFPHPGPPSVPQQAGALAKRGCKSGARRGAPAPPGLRGAPGGRGRSGLGSPGGGLAHAASRGMAHGHLRLAALRLPGKGRASASQVPGGVQHRPWGRCSQHNKGCL